MEEKDNNYITDHTIHGVVIVVDSTSKEAVLAAVRSYFGKEITEEDLNNDGSYTERLYIEESEINKKVNK